MVTFLLQLVSLETTSDLHLHSIHITLAQHTTLPPSGGIDLAKVRSLLPGMGQELPEKSQNLLAAVEHFQQVNLCIVYTCYMYNILYIYL